MDEEIGKGGGVNKKDKLEKEMFEEQGTTACVVYFNKENLWCANAGDSRGCMKRQDDDNEEEDKADEDNVIPLSFDHKPNNKSETQRIYKIKHWVDENTNRVDGTLAVARAFGDFQYKDKFDKGDWTEQAVTAHPDFTQIKLEKDHHFFVLACDGIWDCKTN